MASIGRPSKPVGTLTKTDSGRILLKTENGWVDYARHKLELHLDRKLRREEIIKFIDGNRDNCEPENLEIWEMQRTWPT